MGFQESFDELLESILTDYKNQFNGAIDTSKGSLVFIRSACLASAVWGIYEHQHWISQQIFPDTADTEWLEHHAWVRDVGRKSGETDEAFLGRLLGYIRQPPAGGNKYDYEKWAREIDDIDAAYCFPLDDGLGTVMVVVLADPATGSETPDAAKLAEVSAYIDDVRPVTANTVSVVAPTFINQDVTLVVTGAGVDNEVLSADIEAYLAAFEPGQILYPSQLASIAIDAGADDAQVTSPAAAVVPANHEIIRAGVVSVT